MSDKGLKVRCLDDYTDLPDIIENGATFADNAKIKAQTIAAYLHIPVLADDSGLCVEALNGAPGVYSARFAGEGATDSQNNEKLMDELTKFQEPLHADSKVSSQNEGPQLLSPASYVCALALVDPVANRIVQAEASCDGFIIDEYRGESGFGYDPLFYLPQFGKTMAELSIEEKNKISHRALALDRFLVQFSAMQ
ncbi:Non-canonical purine NTP pyrophosphatase [compost metagenome]